MRLSPGPRRDHPQSSVLRIPRQSSSVPRVWAGILTNRNGVTRVGTEPRNQHATSSLLLPPLPEQRAIAAVLDAIDEAIERTEAVVAATERLRDALLHELLTRGIPGWHTAWKDAPGIGTIPASWEVVRWGRWRR